LSLQLSTSKLIKGQSKIIGLQNANESLVKIYQGSNTKYIMDYYGERTERIVRHKIFSLFQ